MAKVNWDKVDKSFEEGIRKMGAEQLLMLADISASFGDLGKEIKPTPPQKLYGFKIVLENLQKDLIKLKKKDPEIWKKLGLNEETFNKYFSEPESLQVFLLARNNSAARLTKNRISILIRPSTK